MYYLTKEDLISKINFYKNKISNLDYYKIYKDNYWLEHDKGILKRLQKNLEEYEYSIKKDDIKKLFKDIKKQLKLDYAFIDAYRYGDCCGCVNAALVEKYGENSKGIYLKYWSAGMNSSDWDNENFFYIDHVLTDEQGQKILEIIREHGFETNKEFDHSKSIILAHKGDVKHVKD